MGITEDLKMIDTLVGEIKKKHGKSNASGELECPKCGRLLIYGVVKYNGHTAGQCADENCLNWIE